MSSIDVSIYLVTHTTTDKITLEYEINNVLGLRSIPINREVNPENDDTDITEKALKKIAPHFPVDPSDLSLEEYTEYNEKEEFSLEKLETFQIPSLTDLEKKILDIKENLKHTNPEIFL